jgi:uncharacterized protein (TIGR03435 family)
VIAESLLKACWSRLKHLFRCIAILVVLAATAAAQQVPAQPSSDPALRPSFEVAVIRLNRSDSPLEGFETPPGRFQAKNDSVRTLIEAAWELQKGQVVGGPAWIDVERYDIEARMTEDQYHAIENLSKRHQQHRVHLMLQSLLAERFQLRVSHHPGEMKGLALAIAKGGPKLHVSGTLEPAKPDHSVGRSFSGAMFVTKGSPLSDLADYLAMQFGRPVVNDTGLTGMYDYSLEVPYDPQSDREAGTITALEDQLGLTLKSQRIVVDTIHVEQIERPSEN